MVAALRGAMNRRVNHTIQRQSSFDWLVYLQDVAYADINASLLAHRWRQHYCIDSPLPLSTSPAK